MLDLNFVRDNLPLIEAMLRQRGMNPARCCRTSAGGHATPPGHHRSRDLKARRNRSRTRLAIKKTGQDVSHLIAETKDLREKIQELEKSAGEQKPPD